MKWFFAFNQASESLYSDIVRVAIRSAIDQAKLEPFCLYDGGKSRFSDWLAENGVTLWPTRFRFADLWEQVANEKGDSGISRIANGTFLRFELPRLLEEHGVNDEWVLYTDCDVLFQGEVESLLRPLKPRFFAVAPEMWPQNYLHMNAGVMWLHVPTMRQEEAAFMRFARRHLVASQKSSWDQGIYRAYFNPLHRLLWNFGVPDRISYRVLAPLLKRFVRWDRLPLELNWKPFWGENPDARILHFHGPKPHHLAEYRQGTLNPVLRPHVNASWELYCERWQQVWQQIQP